MNGWAAFHVSEWYPRCDLALSDTGIRNAGLLIPFLGPLDASRNTLPGHGVVPKLRFVFKAVIRSSMSRVLQESQRHLAASGIFGTLSFLVFTGL